MATTYPDPVFDDFGYGFDTARELATLDVPVLDPDARAGDVAAVLAGRVHDIEDEVVLCRDGRFVGLVPVERVVESPTHTPLTTLVAPTVPVVLTDARPEQAAWQMVHARDHVVVVVDEAGRFHGLVPSARLAEVLVRAHEEDLARLSGFLHDTSRARLSSTETVGRRLWHRLPWLLLGLVGALLSASLVGGFEATLEANVELAYFLPAIVYLADAVGTQTETLIVRGLSVGVPIRRVVGRELLTGLSLGVLLGAIAVPVIAALLAPTDVAVVVGISIFAASAIATAVAMVLPLAPPPPRRRPGVREWPAGHRRPGPAVDPHLLRRGHGAALTRPRRRRSAVRARGPRRPYPARGGRQDLCDRVRYRNRRRHPGPGPVVDPDLGQTALV